MYKYFKKLENSQELKIYLKRFSFDLNPKYTIKNPQLSTDFLDNYNTLFKRIDFLDRLIVSSIDGIVDRTSQFLSYEDYNDLYDFLCHKREHYADIRQLKEKIDLDYYDWNELLTEYSLYSNFLSEIYPEFQEFLITTGNMLKKANIELEERSVIKLPKLNERVTLTYPNAFYITPNGYLYNTGFGHQEGNLNYLFSNIIDNLKSNKMVSNINYEHLMKETIKRGYVTLEEFRTYGNLKYTIQTVVTPEVEHDRARLKKIIEEGIDFEKLDPNCLPHPTRSYQRNIVSFVVGYYAAKASFNNSFSRMNNSMRKPQLLNELLEYSKEDRADVLVRFCGFHIISSQINKTIVTSSLSAIEDFKLYLDKGWNLQIVPGIVYDSVIDKISCVDFNSCYVNQYLEKQLSNYQGKGKVLIKR